MPRTVCELGMPGNDMSKLARVAWFSALSTFVACSEDPALIQPPYTQRGCATDDQCVGDELCVFRLCSPACQDGGCARGRACFDLGRGSACLRAEENACVDDSDCPAATSCALGRCLSKQCEADAGDTCPEGCEWGLCRPAQVDGGSGKPSDGGTPASCKKDATSCRDNVLQRCEANGRMRDVQTCPFVCKQGACSGSCRPGEQRCQDRTRQSCDDNGSWRDIEMCPSVCMPSGCTTGCTEGVRQCNGSSAMLCRRGQFVEVQRCDYLCQAGACTGSCAPGTHQCRSNVLYTCSAQGSWGMAMDCPNACVGSECAGECMPGTQRCADGGSYQLCNGRGQWSPSIECRNQACADGECLGECAPGATRCEGSANMATCNASGEWGEPVACVDQLCSGDECAGSCVPGAARCRPGMPQQPQVCSAQGSWQDAGSCAANQACVNGACIGACAPATKRCDPLDQRSVQTCLPSGQWSDAVPCPDDLLCNAEAECASAPNCPADASPNWYAPGAGADRSLNDPRWGGALDRFAGTGGSGMDPNAGGYAIVFDRPSNQLVVSVRALAEDSAGLQDYVYFGIRSDQSDGVRAHSARIHLDVTPGAGDPRPLDRIVAFALDGDSWVEQVGAPTWLQHPAAWVMSPEASWAVSFRVDLSAIGVDPALPVRVALGLHAENMVAEHNTVTPAQLIIASAAGALSRSWPALELTDVMCTARAHLP